MKLLRTLTLAYVAILVPTLAASLIAILVYLRRIAGSLEQIGGGLGVVNRNTAPLAGHLDGVHAASIQLADGMTEAREHFTNAATELTAVIQPHLAARPG